MLVTTIAMMPGALAGAGAVAGEGTGAAWRECVGGAAVLATVLQFLAGGLVVRKYMAKGSTAETSPLPFICGFTSCSLWLKYGLIKQDDKIILVNAIGGLLSLAYTIIFYIYTIKKSVVLKQFCAVLAFLMFVFGYSCYELNQELLLSRLGLLACSLTLLFVAAPLTKLFYVLKVKSTECLPFPMILMAFFVSLLWFFYGALVDDPYIKMPNVVGCLLATLQLSLFLIYPSRPGSPISVKSMLA